MLLASDKKADLQNIKVCSGMKKRIEKIQKKYSEKKLKLMRQYGSSLTTLENLAKNQRKNYEYDCLYRAFSRNIHAEDLQEFYYKLDPEIYKTHIQQRDELAVKESFKILMCMVKAMSLAFGLNLENELERLNREFKEIESQSG